MQKENDERKRFADINTELSKRFNEGLTPQKEELKEKNQKLNKILNIKTDQVDFKIGDQVEYKHPKKGLLKGAVIKVKRKKVIFKDKDQKEWDIVKEELKKL